MRIESSYAFLGAGAALLAVVILVSLQRDKGTDVPPPSKECRADTSTVVAEKSAGDLKAKLTRREWEQAEPGSLTTPCKQQGTLTLEAWRGDKQVFFDVFEYDWRRAAKQKGPKAELGLAPSGQRLAARVDRELVAVALSGDVPVWTNAWRHEGSIDDIAKDVPEPAKLAMLALESGLSGQCLRPPTPTEPAECLEASAAFRYLARNEPRRILDVYDALLARGMPLYLEGVKRESLAGVADDEVRARAKKLAASLIAAPAEGKAPHLKVLGEELEAQLGQ